MVREKCGEKQSGILEKIPRGRNGRKIGILPQASIFVLGLFEEVFLFAAYVFAPAPARP
jgi:hypothetical protein